MCWLIMLVNSVARHIGSPRRGRRRGRSARGTGAGRVRWRGGRRRAAGGWRASAAAMQLVGDNCGIRDMRCLGIWIGSLAPADWPSFYAWVRLTDTPARPRAGGRVSGKGAQ